VLLAPLGTATSTYIAPAAQFLPQTFQDEMSPTWHISLTPSGESLTWYIGGTLPHGEQTPLALVIVLESNNLTKIEQIANAIWAAALHP
jgi:hypothetical protein